MRKFTKEQKRDIRAIAAKRDEDIDFSDAPAAVDWSGAEIGKFYRLSKRQILSGLRFIEIARALVQKWQEATPRFCKYFW